MDERRTPAGGRLDAEAAQALAELASSKWQPGVEATEKPRCDRGRADTGIRLAFTNETGQKFAQRRGDIERGCSQVQPHPSRVSSTWSRVSAAMRLSCCP